MIGPEGASVNHFHRFDLTGGVGINKPVVVRIHPASHVTFLLLAPHLLHIGMVLIEGIVGTGRVTLPHRAQFCRITEPR